MKYGIIMARNVLCNLMMVIKINKSFHHIMLAPNLKYKTTMCNYWVQGLICEKGYGCFFAHGQHQIRTIQQNKLIIASNQAQLAVSADISTNYKTIYCKFYTKGECKLGQTCTFAHEKRQKRHNHKKQQPPPPKRNTDQILYPSYNYNYYYQNYQQEQGLAQQPTHQQHNLGYNQIVERDVKMDMKIERENYVYGKEQESSVLNNYVGSTQQPQKQQNKGINSATDEKQQWNSQNLRENQNINLPSYQKEKISPESLYLQQRSQIRNSRTLNRQFQ